MISRGDKVVFISVDRFPGVQIAADLTSELGLEHSLIDTLSAMPSAGRKVLFIDALDAARGGLSEGVFAGLIEDVRRQLSEDWIVVASMRTFDIKNGKRFRAAFAGVPADTGYLDASLSGVRHFLVPRLSQADLGAVGEASSSIGALLTSAPARVVDLLRNIFNLSLAAQLLAEGADPSAIRGVASQSGLIDAYEDIRLPTTQLQRAATVAAKAMIDRRRLSIRKMIIEHESLDGVISSGVLNENGDLVSFAHHVLFDHAVGRFYFEWHEPDQLVEQLKGDTSSAVFFAPALRFAMERIWRFGQDGKPDSWKLILDIFSAEHVDPVLGNIAVRVAVDSVENVQDIQGLLDKISTIPADSLFQPLARLAQFVKVKLESGMGVATLTAIAWARLAESLIYTRNLRLTYPARILLYVLFDRAEFEDAELLSIYGRAARTMLELAWSETPPMLDLSGQAIRFVGRSFASDPRASRALLDRALREPHFSDCADREARWLAEQIIPITKCDPEFASEIYACLYGQTVTDTTKSAFGGQQSRILPLLSTRKQDFNGCRYLLGLKIGEVLTLSPYHGTRAVISAVVGQYSTRSYGSDRSYSQLHIGTELVELRGPSTEFTRWDQEQSQFGDPDDDLLQHYIRFLQGCDTRSFIQSVDAASRSYSTGPVWARILGIGGARAADVGEMLWPLMGRPDFFENRTTLTDAISLTSACWSTRSVGERIRFETMILDEARFDDEASLNRWKYTRDRIVKALPEAELQLESTRELRQSMDVSTNDTFTLPQGSLTGQLSQADESADATAAQMVSNASTRLQERLRQLREGTSADDLSSLWSECVNLLALIDSNEHTAIEIECAAIGNISNVVAHIASNPSYWPGDGSLPTLDAMFAMLERLSSSPYPDAEETDQ
ncbi:hypothetical protein [Pseudomonas viridiflava]|uniref:hypothetical protein n=1 Tax=Pseudomonas viridiflava TaxID=33069 RepID=UPI0013C352D2|nr:hypothetical protein [Pseudomonas viridiflava]